MKDPPAPEEGAPAEMHRTQTSELLPGWVKVFGVVALLLLAAFIALHLTGRGFGGHGLHGSHTGQSQ